MSDGGLTVLLVRHAEPVRPGQGNFAEHQRPLTGRGHRDAAALAESLAASLADAGVRAVISSPYLRAIQTVEPIARRLGIEIEVVDDLRERLLSPADDLPDWRQHLERSWRDFDHALPGGESSRTAQARILAVLDNLKIRHPSGTLVLGSHGNLIGLALQAFEPKVNFEFWAAIPMPAVYRLEFVGGRWRVVEGPGF